MAYYRRRGYRNPRAYYAELARRERIELTTQFGGIDHDIERLFLNFPANQLEAIFVRYEARYGSRAATYARRTYSSWSSGSVKLSGLIAKRLLELVPHFLDAGTKLELVRKLRNTHLRKEKRYITTDPQNWRAAVMPVIDEVIRLSSEFKLPILVTSRISWIADGDALAAQQLLVAAEEAEASIRLQYLESEFLRIDALVSAIANTKRVVHQISLPQADVTVTIVLPRKSLWKTLFSLD